MQIERIFNEKSNINIDEILESLLEELIDTYLSEDYNTKNHTTSSTEGDVQ